LGHLPLVEIDIGLLANQVGVSSADTLDAGQGIHDLLLAIDVGVEETENELKVRLLTTDESCDDGLAVVHQRLMAKAVGTAA
jgi:hypothetical protein